MARVAILTNEGVEMLSLQGRSSLHLGPDDGGLTIPITANSDDDSYDVTRDAHGRLSLVPAKPGYVRWIVLWWRHAHDSVLRVAGFASLLEQSALFDDRLESLYVVAVQGPTDLFWTSGRGMHARTFRASLVNSLWTVAAADDAIWQTER